ncbi:RNA-binding protein [Candidatus Woesearchaeota archaeon]|nr:RNA-binding protein [Candidatus Woesearchaeota archaeon]
MTEEIKVNEKEVVVPGETLATGMGFLPSKGTYREGDNIIAARLGMVHVDRKVIKIIPLSGIYQPKAGDVIIAKIIDVLMSGWKLETNTAYPAMMSMKDATSEYIAKGADLRRYFDVDEYVVAKITNVTTQNLIDLTMRGPGLRKLRGGRVIKVNSNKVPRIIGKHGSMISMVKNATDCKIIVGQNGLVWVDGEPDKEKIAVDTIKKIEEESHVSGLTDLIKSHLEKVTGKKLEITEKGE